MYYIIYNIWNKIIGFIRIIKAMVYIKVNIKTNDTVSLSFFLSKIIYLNIL